MRYPQDYNLVRYFETLSGRFALPGEKPGSVETLRDAMSRDVPPMTGCETVISENPFQLEWSSLELRCRSHVTPIAGCWRS